MIFFTSLILASCGDGRAARDAACGGERYRVWVCCGGVCGGVLRSRPTWRILLYSAEEPPEKRGFVLVDGVDGEIVEQVVEANPEDWSDLDGKLTS